jgi:hypothetical protein
MSQQLARFRAGAGAAAPTTAPPPSELGYNPPDMFRLTREVRFAVNDAAGDDDDDEHSDSPPSNSYGGYPSLVGYGRYYTLAVTLAGELDPATGYLRNIKEIDDAVRGASSPPSATTCSAGRSRPARGAAAR